MKPVTDYLEIFGIDRKVSIQGRVHRYRVSLARVSLEFQSVLSLQSLVPLL